MPSLDYLDRFPDEKPKFTIKEILEITEVVDYFEVALEKTVESIESTTEMKTEVEDLDRIARWEAVVKISKVKSDPIRTLDYP